MRPSFVQLSLTVFLGSVSALACAQETKSAADAPAIRRGREVAAILGSGDRAAAATYIAESFGEEFRRQPLARHLELISRTYDATRGVEIQSEQSRPDGEAVLLLKGKLTGDWHELVVRVEPDAPHRIARVGLRRGRPPAGVAARAKLTDEQKASELEAWLQKLADADVFSGAVLLAKGERVIFKKAYGMANKDFDAPNRVDTKFNLGSMNKMFTAVAVAQLVERGKLSFEDPLAKFLPSFPDAESATKIKLQHLLSHTAGLGSFFNKKFHETSRELYRTVDEMLQLAQEDKLAFEPGTRWQYSNTGMLVAGKVVQEASGQDYFVYMRENVYQPAGMANTDCYELDRVNRNLAVGYDKEFGDDGCSFRNNVFQHVMRGGPAGGGYSTVEDLHRFAVALRAGKLVGVKYVDILLSAKPELGSPKYGYGFDITSEMRIVGHSGGFPGIGSNLDMFLDSDYIAIVMSNYGGASRRVTDELRELVTAGN